MNQQEIIEQLRDQGYEVTIPSPVRSPSIDTLILIQEEIAALEKRLDRIEKRSGLMSKSFLNRAYTVWAYFLFAQLMIGLVLLAVGMIFGLIS